MALADRMRAGVSAFSRVPQRIQIRASSKDHLYHLIRRIRILVKVAFGCILETQVFLPLRRVNFVPGVSVQWTPLLALARGAGHVLRPACPGGNFLGCGTPDRVFVEGTLLSAGFKRHYRNIAQRLVLT